MLDEKRNHKSGRILRQVLGNGAIGQFLSGSLIIKPPPIIIGAFAAVQWESPL